MPRHSAFAFARAIDVVAALAMLVATAPLLLAVALAIKLESRGPLFAPGIPLRFRTHRIGRNGAVLERGWLGELLWTARLDELPQFISLLRGDVSLFGEDALQLGANG